MPIHPLPVFEADADPYNRDGMTDAEIYARLQAPDSLVVKFGYLKWVAEYPYSGDVKPGCGTKLVARTHRGTEIVEMLTTTCENAGCNKSITRQEMLEYIENSGGKDYPFYTDGHVLRVATIEDLSRMSELNGRKREWTREVKSAVTERMLDMKVVEIEPILGEEMLTVYFMADERVDFRELVRYLAGVFKTRIEMRQVGARDEARLVADYERCGQHCCCKNFLKVLKPVSMRAAKMQKATLDPLKISGRCGRLMCCLRYEDQTYRDLKKNLPHRKSRVGTPYGPGMVIDGKILVQLVLVRLEHNDEQVAVPVEELMDPEECPQPAQMSPAELRAFEMRLAGKDADDTGDPLRGLDEEEVQQRTDPQKRKRRRGRRGDRSKSEQQDQYRERSQKVEGDQTGEGQGERAGSPQRDTGDKKERSRRRGRRRRGKGSGGASGGASGGGGAKPSSDDNVARDNSASSEGKPRPKRRRRGRGRNRGKGGDGGDNSGGGNTGCSNGGSGGGPSAG